jgi:hypothetical protein
MLTPTPETPKKNGLLVRQEAADKSKQQANSGLVFLCSRKVTVGLPSMKFDQANRNNGAFLCRSDAASGRFG